MHFEYCLGNIASLPKRAIYRCVRLRASLRLHPMTLPIFPPFSRRVRRLCLVLLALLALHHWCNPALADVEVEIDLFHLAGNLTVAQRDELLADPGWSVRATYAPLISVPGVTASWSRCGFLSLPCLADDVETVRLSSAEIRREGTRFRFSLPRYVGIRRFRLAHVGIEMAKNPYDSFKRPETYFYVSDEDGTNRSPVILDGGSFVLAGSLTTTGAQFRQRHGCPDSDTCWGTDAQGAYLFKPQHRFAFYRHGYQFPDKEAMLSQPLPAELKGMKIYRATLKSRQVDGHLVELLDISATENRADCSSDDLQYEILYVDGEAIRYSKRMPDPDPAQCRGHYRRIEWDDAGQPQSYGGMLVEWVNHGSSITYSNWQANCTALVSGNYSRCNSPPPGIALEVEIRGDARRVRAWFPLVGK